MLIPEVSEKITRKKKFKFENAWLTEPMCKQLVLESWENDDNADIQGKIKNCGEKLLQWGSELTSKFGKRIK